MHAVTCVTPTALCETWCPVMADTVFLKNFGQSDCIEFLQLVTVLRTRCGPKFVAAVSVDNSTSVFRAHWRVITVHRASQAVSTLLHRVMSQLYTVVLFTNEILRID